MAKNSNMGLDINCGSFYIPKENPSRPKGEDAHFICRENKAVGVADGVGGCNSAGVDPGEYARALMAKCAAEVVVAAAKGAVEPKRVLIKAHRRTNVPGSSTASVLALRGDMLCAANIGDSGFMIFRNKKIVYSSETQQHFFNCPYQLEACCLVNRPSDAWVVEVEIFAGDIIVLATDGLLDNVYVKDIEQVLMEDTVERVEPGVLAKRLAELALRNSLDPRISTPFASAASEAGFLYDGGKVDDITVVVVHVVEK